MYDRKSEANEFVADTEEEASAKACRFYGVEASELNISSLEDVSGLEGRKLVVASPRGFRPSPDKGDRGRGGGGGRPEGRDRGRGRSRERGRETDSNRRGGSRSKSSGPSMESEDAAKVSKGEAKGTLQAGGVFVLGALERMGLGNFEVTEVVEAESNSVIYQIQGEASEELASGDGRAIDALQLLANQAVRSNDENPARIVLEIDGANDRRAESLEKVAERAADRAVESGRSLALEAMNGRDRRIVHLALKDRADVATMGIGEGRYRQVLVVPEGAPEYQDALDSAQEKNSS